MNKKLITYLVSFAAFFGPFTQSIYTPLLPEVKEAFQTSEYTLNLTISIFTFVMAIMQIAYGPLIDIHGRRKLLLPGILFYIAASVGAALSPSVYVLIFFRILQAMGMAVGSVVATTVIGDLYTGNLRGRAMGTFQMLVALGPVVGPVIGGFTGQYFGFHGVFWVLAGGGILLFILNYFFLPETKPAFSTEKRFEVKDFFLIMKRPVGSAILALGFTQYFSFYIFLVFLPSLLSKDYGLTPSQNGSVFLPLSLAVMSGSLIGGRWQEKFSPKLFLLCTAVCNALTILLFVLVAPLSLPFLIFSIVVFGLCLGISLPIQTTLLANEFIENRATALGVYNFFRYVGMGAGLLIGTYFFHLGNYLEFISAFILFVHALLYAAVRFKALPIKSIVTN